MHFLKALIFCFAFLLTSLTSHEHNIKIYDCFLFFNELEILKVRLEELYDYVDKFVLVESIQTFKGDPKPLYYQENKALFEKYNDKIIYVCVENFDHSNPWEREYFQRAQIMRGLKKCKNNDLIMISDLDEIIAAESLPRIIHGIYNERHPRVLCFQRLYRFYLNMRDNSRWPGSAATTFKHLKTTNPSIFRNDRYSAHPLEDMGWHFTYMGGIPRVITKLNSFSHNEFDNMFDVSDPPKKFWDTFCSEYFLVDIDTTYPKFIQDNVSYFKDIGFIASPEIL